MQDRKRRRDASDTSAEPTVASILGLSGPIRFRLHGSSQKAHLVLRRVQVSDDSDDDQNAASGSPTTAFYSLFAHKRIEVKPGKEILLAIEGEFNERAVLIGGDLPGFQHNADSTSAPTLGKGMRREDPKPQSKDFKSNPEVAVVADNEGKERDLLLTVPPKMRKSWMKGRHSLPDLEPPNIRSNQPIPSLREDVGIQAQPEYASVVVETTRIPGPSCAVQTSNEVTTREAQTADEYIIPSAANTVRRTEERVGSRGLAQNNPEPESEGSLSPMEMSSTPSTPEQNHSLLSPPVQTNSEFSPRGPKAFSSLPPERPISPSSSASSAPDELDIKLITDIEKPFDLKPVPLVSSSPPPSLQSSPTLSSNKSALSDARNIPLFLTPTSSTPVSALGSSSQEQTPLVPFSSAILLADEATQSSMRNTDTASNRDTSWNPHTASSMGSYYPRPVQGRSGPDMFTLWGTAATGTWGNPSPASMLRGCNAHAPSGSSMGSETRNPRQPSRSSAGDKSGRTPPDLKSLVSLSSGPNDNPLGIRPSSVHGRLMETVTLPTQRPSLVLPMLEGKRGLLIGSDWPPKTRGTSVTTNGNPSSQTPPTCIDPSAINRSSTPQLINWKTSDDLDDSSSKWRRMNDDEASSRSSRHRSVDSAAVKSEPSTDSIVPRMAAQSAAGIYANGKAPLQHPNFVGYTPPTKSLSSVSTRIPGSTELPPQDTRSESETPSRGVKRSASIVIDASSKAASPLSSSKRIFRWPTSRPVYTAQIQGTGTDIRSITFNSDGSQFAVCCNDSSVRIWNNANHEEVAKLAHVAPVVSVAWMDGDSGVVSLGGTGEVSKWTRVGGNKWHWAKLLDASRDHRPGTDPTSFAYMRDRIAIAFPRVGVKVWLWVKGIWQPQRSILRQNVTSIKFVEEGEALLGGTADGVLWYCQIPNGTLRAYSFFKSGVYLLDVNSTGSHLLVSRNGGVAHLVSVVQDDRKGKTEREYSLEDEAPGASGQGAMFTNVSQSVIFGTIQGCLLVWDKNKVVIGLDHGEDATIQTVVNFDSRRTSPGYLITGTESGVLSWWAYPPMTPTDSNKRVRTQ